MKHLFSLKNWVAVIIAAIVPAVASVGFAASTEVQILSATLRDQAIAGASVTLQKNGEQSVVGTTGADGKVSLNASFADSAEGLLIVKKSGYSNLVVKCPCAGMTYAISPVMTNLDGMRVVLNWGAAPADLDSHILYPDNHVYFSNMEGTDAALDVDDTSSYGPETITVSRKHEGERYVYAVHDYSNGGTTNSSALSNSNAKVFVYVGQTLVKTYYVPKNKKGNLWTAFAVTESGEFQDINTIENVASEDRLQTAQFQGVIDNSHAQVATAGADSKTRAKALNTQGETAFRAKSFDEAVYLFQEAIALDDNYGQAYSNLGLTFQQMGRVAEALWANRKAIALANGTTAATVRASSHYNNGRIYEAAGQWSDALREYRSAKQEKANTVYDNAIKRMQDKGAQ